MLTQRFSQKTVLEAARERVSFILDNFETVIVSVSGGKDSTVLSHLALVEAKKRGRKIGIYFLDEEVVYQSTVEQVLYIMHSFPDAITKIWLQLEFHLTNTSSVEESQLICWEAGKHEVWMRSRLPFTIQHPMWDPAKQSVQDKNKGFGFYDVIRNFEGCYRDAAFLVGVRANESPTRWRAVVKNPVKIGGRDVYWATKKGQNTALYPLYDWNFHDVWRYIYECNLKYSKIYDYQFKKGYPVNKMRVSSLIHEKSFHSICDLPEFEPKTYDRLLKRIKGISLVQENGKKAKLFACRKLPKNFKSWKTYRDFLLATHADRERLWIFQKRFSRHLDNEYVARQQVRQLVLGDYENNLPVDNQPDPREELVRYYEEVL